MIRYATILILLLVGISGFGQTNPKVGLVLSGGGADGMAHVGMLKALEEHGIYVTHITGSSMGALVGGLYASGYTPQEMEEFFTSPEFFQMVNGEPIEKYRYEWAKSKPDPTIISLAFAKDSIFKARLPTNLIDPKAIDFSLMERFAPASAYADYDFDSLFIPFRCVASDIYEKQTITFDSGNLSVAVRASMSYPFYIKPIQVENKLLFDGGLYNNFPADVMCNEFDPDFIIGSKVASNGPPPNEDDLYSQVRALLVNETEFDINCIEHVIVEPQVNFGVFEFENAQAAIDSGYFSTIRNMDKLKSMIYGLDTDYNGIRQAVFTDRVAFEENRKKYRKALPKLIVKKVSVEGINEKQQSYAKRVLFKKSRKSDSISLNKARSNYFRLANNQKIRGVYPKSVYIDSLQGFEWNNQVKTQSDLTLKFGGNFGSRPISSGFIGLQYNRLAKWGLEAEGNAQFGKLYAAGHGRIRFDAPWKIPFYAEPFITFHRWDYFESRLNTLFTDDVPSFIVSQEQFVGIETGIPFGNRGIITQELKYFRFNDEYYQTENFTPGDTVDQSMFEGYTLGLGYRQNNLDDKQYATSGKRIRISGKLVLQTEEYRPGSTSLDSVFRVIDQSWFQIKFEIENYFRLTKKLKLGLEGTAFISGQPFFHNYTSSVIRANGFQPTPDSRTLFLESFRANEFVAGGIKFVYKFSKNWHGRAEGYIFQPYQAINKGGTDRSAKYGNPFEVRHSIVSSTIVYQSPIGPFSASVNYYYNNTQVSPGEQNPVTFLFNYGFILFRDKALN